MLVKKTLITRQVVVPQLAREIVMKHAHRYHRGMSATLQEIKRICYWPNCTLDKAQMVHKCSICLEKHWIDLHNGEAFDRGTTKAWELVHVDLIGPFSPLAETGIGTC